MSIRRRLRDLIGGSKLGFSLNNKWYNFTLRDVNRADYKTYDAMRRAKAKGYELSGLILKPLGSKITSWVLGRAPEWKFSDEKTEVELAQWLMRWHESLLRAYEEAIDLGDCFLIINGDLSATVVPPHVVTPITDTKDLSKIIGWRVQERFQDPEKPSDIQTVTDEYTVTGRLRVIERGGKVVYRHTYRNVIKRVPIVHINNQIGADEMFGRPEGEGLTYGLQIFNEALLAALKGNIRQGRPTPVIQKMGTASQLESFWSKFGRKERQTLPDGTVEEIDVIPFNPDQLLTLGGDSEFEYKAPGSFSGDTDTLLGILFKLFVIHTEIPEFVWGNAISASKASADTQVEPFIKWLQKKRSRSHQWLNEVARIVIAYMSVFDPEINTEELPVIQWKPLTSGDGRLTLDTIIWAWTQQLIDSETAVSLMPVSISDPKAVLAAAQAEEKHVKPVAPPSTDNKSDKTGGNPKK